MSQFFVILYEPWLYGKQFSPSNIFHEAVSVNRLFSYPLLLRVNCKKISNPLQKDVFIRVEIDFPRKFIVLCPFQYHHLSAAELASTTSC